MRRGRAHLADPQQDLLLQCGARQQRGCNHCLCRVGHPEVLRAGGLKHELYGAGTCRYVRRVHDERDAVALRKEQAVARLDDVLHAALRRSGKALVYRTDFGDRERQGP